MLFRSEVAQVVADAIVSCHLRTMARLDIHYDLLARESEILHLKFWDAAFEMLKKSEIEPIGTDVNSITWFNGLILGLAAERDIDAIGLFGEISETTVPQPLAAKSIVKAFAKMENITLDTKLLDEQYEEVLDRTQKDKEPSRFRPGIG